MPKVLIDGQYVDVPLTALFNDDGQTPFAPPSLSQEAVNGRVFSEEDVARIRQEEKDKLYSTLEASRNELAELRNQVGSLTAAEQRREAQLVEEQERLEAEARAREAEELDAKSLLAKREQEWNNRLNEIETSWSSKLQEQEQARLAAEAVAQREREYAELGDYTRSQVEANKDKIAPQLLPWITGNSKEEVDAAVARAISTTDSIAAEMQGLVPDPTQQQIVPGVQTPAPPAVPGTRVTTGPVSDPGAQFQQLTAEDIASMPMDQYAKLRQQAGIGGQSNNRGMFG